METSIPIWVGFLAALGTLLAGIGFPSIWKFLINKDNIKQLNYEDCKQKIDELEILVQDLQHIIEEEKQKHIAIKSYLIAMAKHAKAGTIQQIPTFEDMIEGINI